MLVVAKQRALVQEQLLEAGANSPKHGLGSPASRLQLHCKAAKLQADQALQGLGQVKNAA